MIWKRRFKRFLTTKKKMKAKQKLLCSWKLMKWIKNWLKSWNKFRSRMCLLLKNYSALIISKEIITKISLKRFKNSTKIQQKDTETSEIWILIHFVLRMPCLISTASYVTTAFTKNLLVNWLTTIPRMWGKKVLKRLVRRKIIKRYSPSEAKTPKSKI